MLRNIVAKLNSLFTESSHAARERYSFPIKITFQPTYNTGNLNSAKDNLYISGETFDLSRSGVGFIVSSIRVRENYLVGQDRHLNAEIELPEGKIRMTIIGRRYEKVGIHLSTERFLIGAEIVEISKDDREVYEQFMKFGKRTKVATPSLEMGGNP